MKDLKIKFNGEYYGVVDKNNVIIVPFIYDEILRTFASGLINVCKNDKWGCLDLEGNVVTPLEYDWISPFGNSNSSISSAKKDGKWGILDKNGFEIIPCVYDEEVIFKHEIAIASMNGKRGLIDKEGKIIIPCQYLYLKPLANSLKYFKFNKNGKYGILDAAGNIVVSPTYNNPDCLHMLNPEKQNTHTREKTIGDNLFNKYEAEKTLQKEYEIVESFYPHLGIYIVGKSNKMGVVRFHDNKADIVVSIEYDQIEELFKNTYLLLAKKTEKYRVIKVTKRIAKLSPFYDKIGKYYSYAGLIPVKSGNHVGAVNNKAEEVIPVQYDLLDNYAFHAISAEKLVMRKGGKWGIMANDGKVLLPFEYDEIDYDGIFYRIPDNKNGNGIITPNDYIYSSALIPVKKDNRWGLLDAKLKCVVPCIYQAIHETSANKLELRKKKGHDMLIMTKNGPQVTYFSTEKLNWFSSVGEFQHGFAIVQKDGKYGYIDEIYNGVAPCVYDNASPFKDGIAIVGKDGKYGCIDMNGKEIAPCIYDEVSPFLHGISIVRIKEKYGAIDKHGNLVIPVEYLILGDFSLLGPVILMAVKNRSFGVIDKKNNIIVPFEYDMVEPIMGSIKVIKQGKKGLFDHKGKQIVAPIFDDFKVTNTSINVCINGKWGVVNNKGQQICEPQYDEIDSYGFACGRLAVCREGKWGFINRNGREVINCIYDKVYQFFEENRCEVKLNGEKIAINIYGKIINV